MKFKWLKAPSMSRRGTVIFAVIISLEFAAFCALYKLHETVQHAKVTRSSSPSIVDTLAECSRLGDDFAPLIDHGLSVDRVVQLTKAFSYATSEQFPQAHDVLSRAIASDNSNSALYFLRGLNYLGWMRMKSAADDFQVSVQLNPNGQQSHASNLYKFTVAQLDEAKKRLADRKEITQASPSSMARVHVASAYNYSALEQYEIAVTECNKALELDSHCAYAYGMRGSAYSDLGNYDKGIADCSKAINIEPDDPVHYMQRARIYRYMQRLDLALRDKEQEQRCWKKMDEEKVQREKIAEENRQKELELAYIKMHKNDPEALKLLRGQLTTDSH